MTEIRLAIIFAFVVLFWGLALGIYFIAQGEWIAGIVMITVVIPVTLIFWMKAREDWNS